MERKIIKINTRESRSREEDGKQGPMKIACLGNQGLEMEYGGTRPHNTRKKQGLPERRFGKKVLRERIVKQGPTSQLGIKVPQDSVKGQGLHTWKSQGLPEQVSRIKVPKKSREHGPEKMMIIGS